MNYIMRIVSRIVFYLHDKDGFRVVQTETGEDEMRVIVSDVFGHYYKITTAKIRQDSLCENGDY